MKVSIAIVFSLSLFTTSVAVLGVNSNEKLVHIAAAKKQNLFIFKANKSWQGAKVEVQSPDGNLISQQRLVKRKMMIDFYGMKRGTYKIIITKNNDREEFEYIKK